MVIGLILAIFHLTGVFQIPWGWIVAPIFLDVVLFYLALIFGAIYLRFPDKIDPRVERILKVMKIIESNKMSRGERASLSSSDNVIDASKLFEERRKKNQAKLRLINPNDDDPGVA
jgi:uncharacterized protein YacL